jgi:hypothetical protein
MRSLRVLFRSRTLRIVAACAVAVSATMTVGCDDGNPRSLITAVQASVEALVLHAAINQLVAIAYDADPALGVVVELGIYASSSLNSSIQRAEYAAPTATFLIIQQVINGTTKYTVYKITTQQTLVVALNGQFIETFSPHKITVDVVPGTDSTIVVTVKHPKNLIYRTGKFSQFPYDFDGGLDGPGKMASSQVEINRSWDWLQDDWSLITRNGTLVSRWNPVQLPTLANCASIPPGQWSTTVISGQNWGTVAIPGSAWCLHTAAGHYGIFICNYSRDEWAGYTFDYLLWKTPREES